jgi:hypothetical protein
VQISAREVNGLGLIHFNHAASTSFQTAGAALQFRHLSTHQKDVSLADLIFAPEPYIYISLSPII